MSTTNPSNPLTLFLSYSHRDEGLLDELRTHLSIMKRQGILATWHDREIDAGDEWKTQIDAHLESADIILLLVSPDFLNSDYCWNLEMKRAIERHNEGSARVIPVFLRPCDWSGAPFEKLQGLPQDARPITSFANRDEAFTAVAKGLRSMIGKFRLQCGQPSPVASSVAEAPRETGHPTPSLGNQRKSATSLDDTGDLVLLDGLVLQAERVEETQGEQQRDSTMVKAWIVPRSAEEEALLRSFRSDRNQGRRPVSYAHRNEAFLARVASATSESSGGKVVWKLEILPYENRQGAPLEVAFNGVSADQVAEMRARFILLDERPSRGVSIGDVMLSAMVTGQGNGLKLEGGIFPRLWKERGSDSDTEFLAAARLWAIYHLKVSNTCEHILELSLGPVQGSELVVRFRGRRHQAYANVEPKVIRVSGMCPLRETG